MKWREMAWCVTNIDYLSRQCYIDVTYNVAILLFLSSVLATALDTNNIFGDI